MEKTIELVGEFHRAFGVSELPERGIPDARTRMVRHQLICSELGELSMALAARDQVGVLDACLDLQYVIDGTYRCFGLIEDKVNFEHTTLIPARGIFDDERNEFYVFQLTYCLGAYQLAVWSKNVGQVSSHLGEMDRLLACAICNFGFQDIAQRAFEEVHRSNMSKLDENGQPLIHASGRVMKSNRYSPPDLVQFFPF